MNPELLAFSKLSPKELSRIKKAYRIKATTQTVLG